METDKEVNIVSFSFAVLDCFLFVCLVFDGKFGTLSGPENSEGRGFSGVLRGVTGKC